LRAADSLAKLFDIRKLRTCLSDNTNTTGAGIPSSGVVSSVI